MRTLQCLSRDALKEYLSGWTDAEECDAIESHLTQCSDCEQTIVALESDPETLIEFVRKSHNQASVGKTPITDSAVAYALSRAKKLSTASDEPTAPWQPPAGDFGPYELLRPLGHGGMASVYLARHRQLGKQVAIKLLPTRPFRNDHYAARFQREIRTAGQLNHPAIVSATDAGEQAGTHYLVMEYIEGLDLSRVARLNGPLPIADACSIMRTVAIGLSHAHAEGIVHRDIKPSNLMLSQAGEVKILDFGLAQVSLWDEISAELTTVGQLMGTLDYMAPEQAERPEAVDYRADLYSIGATLFRLLCGRAPLAAAPDLSPLVKLRLLASHQPPRLDTLRTDAPEKLVEFVAQLLARNPADRPASAAHVAEQLAQFTEAADLKSLITAAQSKSQQEPATASRLIRSPAVETQPSSSGSGRRITRWLLAASLLPLLIFAGVLITLETQKGQLVIESESANVEVKLLRDGEFYEKLKIIPGINSTRLYAGKYEVIIDSPSDAVTFDQPEIEIKRGKISVAKVSSRPSTLSSISSTGSSSKSLPASTNRLRANDQVVVVGNDEWINSRVVVMSDLTIKLPLVGVLSVENDTVESLQVKLRKEYERFLKNPSIEVFLGRASQPVTASFVIDSAPMLTGAPPMNAAALEPGDGIVVVNVNDRTLTTRAVVLADNTIRLPLIGTVNIGFTSVSGLERRLDDLYAKYFKEPRIEVFRSLSDGLSQDVGTNGTEPYKGLDGNSPPPLTGLLYGGKTLAAWLETVERERSPEELKNALEAIDSLASDTSAAKQIEEVMLKVLPKLNGQMILVAGTNTSYTVDDAAFSILLKCHPNPKSYFEMLASQLDMADDEWAARIVRWGIDDAIQNIADFEPVRRWIVAQVFNSDLHQRCLELASQHFLQIQRLPSLADSQKQVLINDLLACKKLGLDFWLAAPAPFQSVVWTQPYATAVESNALAALSSADTEKRLVGQALRVFELVYSPMYKQHNLTPSSSSSEVSKAIEIQFNRLLADNAALVEMTPRQSTFQLPPGNFQPLFGKMDSLQLKLSIDWRLGDSATNLGLELLKLMNTLKVKDENVPLIEKVANAAAPEAYLFANSISNPYMPKPVRMQLGWPTLELQGPDVLPSQSELLSYMIFDRAFGLLPEVDRNRLESQHLKRLRLSWLDSLIKKIDQDADRKLSYSECQAEFAKPNQFRYPVDAVAVDTNGDQFITSQELFEYLEGPPPSASKTPQPAATVAIEPIYEGRPLSEWLEQFGRERSPAGTGTALEAINALVAKSDAQQVEKTLLENLRLLGNRTIVYAGKNREIDGEAFPVLARCSTTRKEYFQMLSTQLESADESWATRIFKSAVERYSWEPEHVQPLLTWIETNVLKAKKSPELTRAAANLYLEMLSGSPSTPEFILLKNRLVDSLASSEQVGLDFWLSQRPYFESNGFNPNYAFRPYFPLFASAIESKAMAAITNNDSSDLIVTEAAALLSALNSGKYDREGMGARPVAAEFMFIQALGKRLVAQTADAEHRSVCESLGTPFNGLKGQGIKGRFPFLKRHPVNSQMTILESAEFGPRGPRKRNVALELLDCIVSLKLESQLQSALRLVVDATNLEAQEFAIDLDANRQFINFANISISYDRLDVSPFLPGVTKFTGKDCLDYIIFARAFLLLPEAEQAEIELAHWMKRLDIDGDGSLSYEEAKAEMPDPGAIDANQDQLISNDEFLTFLKANIFDSPASDPGLDWVKKQFAKYDRNKDGRLTVDEWNVMMVNPEGADTNNDGAITPEEYAAFRNLKK